MRTGEVRSLRLADVDIGLRQVRVVGKGGRERVVPVHRRFFVEVTNYLRVERPAASSAPECFVVLRELLGHYAGEKVKRKHQHDSGSFGGEAFEEPVEDLLSADLALVGGVVALALEGGPELDGGLEERARFADRLEVAVEADGPGAVAIAEHAAVHLGAEFAHLGSLGVGGQFPRSVVESLDLFGDREVLVGDGAVGDTGIHHGHAHRSMPEKCGYHLERHAPVDGLGRERVTQTVRADVADPRGPGRLGDGPVDAALADALAVLDKQVRAAQAGRSVRDPGVEQFFELWVQRDVAVRAELADGHVKPVGGADLHDGVDGEVQELAFAQAGAGQELDGQAHERVGVGAGGLQQLGERCVIEEAGQGCVAQGQVAVEDQHPGGDIVTVPFGETFEAGAEPTEVFGQAGLGEGAPPGRGPSCEVQFVVLDVTAVEIGDACDLGGVDTKPAGELAKDTFDTNHRRWPQRQAHLGDVARQRGRQHRCARRPLVGPLGGPTTVGLSRRGVEHTEVEQGGLHAEQRRTERLRPVAVGSMTADGGDQRRPSLVDDGLRYVFGGHPGQDRHPWSAPTTAAE